MTLRLVQVNFKARDDSVLGSFWARALGWETSSEGPGVTNIEPPGIPLPDPIAVGVDVVAVPGPETVAYRAHLELAATSVERLVGLGATLGEGAWLHDPEGNLFTVREPRADDEHTGPISAVVVDCSDPHAMGRFWSGALDWTLLESTAELARLRSGAGVGPFLEFRRSTGGVRTRMHLDVRPYPGDDQAAEVARLLALGAAGADIGQGDVPWTVLTDVEGNEFCVLTPG